MAGWFEMKPRADVSDVDTPTSEYVRLDAIDVLGYPTRSNDGVWIIKISVNGKTVTPRYKSMEECLATYEQLKSALGI